MLYPLTVLSQEQETVQGQERPEEEDSGSLRAQGLVPDKGRQAPEIVYLNPFHY